MAGVTPYVATYAAIVSTYVAARQVWRDRPAVRVFVAPIYYVDERDGELGRCVRVRAINGRNRSIQLESAGLVTAQSRRLHSNTMAVLDHTSDECPLMLAPGDSATFFFKGDEADLRGAWCRDYAGKEHTARYWRRWVSVRGRRRYRAAIQHRKRSTKRQR